MDSTTLDQQDHDDLSMPSELEVLKQRATLLGVPFSNNIGLETLRERVAAKLAEAEGEAPATPATATLNPLDDNRPEAPVKKETVRQRMQREQMKLVRLRITNLDPKKKDLHGEIFTVANEFLGTVRKFVPFGEVTDDGYHVPYCIYKMMEKRRFLNIRTYKDRRNNNQIRVESNWAKEFALEILPDLTPEELRQLATAQAAAGGLS